MARNAVLMQDTGEELAERKARLVRLGCGIAALRLHRRMTRKALASRLGVSSKLLGYWERGACRPPVEMFVELCRELRTTTEDLLAAGEMREAYLLRRHGGPEVSERRSDMSNETSEETSVTPGVGIDPGIVPIEPDLKSERVQEEGVAPEPGPVQAG
jgi:transcriptional regulator with XRE-family HTH domain